jgi:hypothetical protein
VDRWRGKMLCRLPETAQKCYRRGDVTRIRYVKFIILIQYVTQSPLFDKRHPCDLLPT